MKARQKSNLNKSDTAENSRNKLRLRKGKRLWKKRKGGNETNSIHSRWSRLKENYNWSLKRSISERAFGTPMLSSSSTLVKQ
jgi:hypothetical protein